VKKNETLTLHLNFLKIIIKMRKIKAILFMILGSLIPVISFGSEANLPVPDLAKANFPSFFGLDGWHLLLYGLIAIVLGYLFVFFSYNKIKKLPSHISMKKVGSIIYATCKTYLKQQGKFLLILFLIIVVIMGYYFIGLTGTSISHTLIIFIWTILGILGSYSAAWFGIRINTLANARTSFASLRGKPWNVVAIPLQSGMSVGTFLVTTELVMMLFILLFIPQEIAGMSFVGFAIGESLGASALRIAGGIFTKIADIGADLMKIIFNLPEDDPRNPGVIADCTGDNAGDSIGPTADGFETYGVTGVALISFIILAMGIDFQPTLIVWIFAMRVMMLYSSLIAYWINNLFSKAKYGNSDRFNFEAPLTSLVWITSIFSIILTYLLSYLLLNQLNDKVDGLWWKLSTIISLGTLAAAIIPELIKSFTSSRSRHVQEVVTASREGGASLNILSGIVAGNFSAFWIGLVMAGLMLVGFYVSFQGFDAIMTYPSIFAFGLIAFGFLGMGPVTIAVDSYGPVTDNAQSVFELSRIEKLDGIKEEINKDYGFTPDFENGKYNLEANDGAGNTFKATAKPVLIGTAVIGATTMIFSIILILSKTIINGVPLLNIELTSAPVILGFIMGGAVIYWFSGASTQAVTTGAYRAVEFIKKNISLDKKEADIEDSKSVVKICTVYAQKGMWNIFIVLLSLTLAFAFFDPNFFVSYLISIAVFGLFQALYMANAGGAWDNAKKVVEVDLKEAGTPLHEAAVVGDTVGDPYKDTTSVALNPIIKFSTLFGLLAAEISIELISKGESNISRIIGTVFLLIGLFFVYKSFYGMRIKKPSEK